VFWREAISSLHVLVGVRCSGGIASPDCYQARNDAMGLFARNDAPFRHCEERSDEAISSLHILVGVMRSGGIASPDCYQARNDGVGLQARNDEKVACNGNFSQVNKEKELKKNKIINQQKLNAYEN
jgi:hypothetical protein